VGGAYHWPAWHGNTGLTSSRGAMAVREAVREEGRGERWLSGVPRRKRHACVELWRLEPGGTVARARVL